MQPISAYLSKALSLLALVLCLSVATSAQEFEFQVTINTPKLQTADPKVFESLETALRDFLNNQKWTNDVFEPEERIKCNIQLTIREEYSDTEFKADLNIQAVRPIYGSSYETVLLSHADKDVRFNYEQYQPIEYSENSFRDNLSSIFAFYANLIIGMDYDSFSPFGGEDYFQKAQDIISNIPPTVASKYPGWRSLDGNTNRFWIIENLLSPRVRPYRQAMYDYHRASLDVMHLNADAAKTKLVEALEAIGNVNKSYPNSIILQMFTNAKSNEIIEIFKVAEPRQKAQVYQIMTKVDVANASKYRDIRF